MKSSSVVSVLFFIFFLSLFSSITSRSISISSEEEVSHHEKAEWFMKSSHFAKFLPQKAGLSLEELPKISSPPSNPLVPVVIVPSFFGNAIYASLSHADPGHFYCRDNSKDYVLFFDELRFIPPLINCWMADMLIEYSNHTYSYPEGVEINAEMDYGNTTVLEWINSGHTIGIWNSTVAALVAAGYERGVSVRGAPADWRLGANGWTPYWSRLKGLIEETYTLNGNQKVAVAALSMGSPYFLGFLNTMVNQTWKDTYIHSFTSMSGVFGGSSAAIAALLGGDNGFVPKWVNPNSYDALARSIGAVAFLLPTPQVFQDTTLVSTPDGNYTASDFPELLDMVGANTTSQMLIDMASIRNFSAPGVPLHCVVGYNLSTVATVNYPTGFGGNVTSTSEDGDGVVLSQSLDVCDGWNTTQTQPINTIRVPNMQHGDPVFDPQVISYFLSVLGIQVAQEDD